MNLNLNHGFWPFLHDQEVTMLREYHLLLGYLAQFLQCVLQYIQPGGKIK